MRIFVAGPYNDSAAPEIKAENVKNADEAARELVLMGHLVFCPHKMTQGWEDDPRLTSNHWFGIDQDILIRWADALFRLPGESKGSDREEALALSLGMLVFHSYEEVLDYSV